MVNSFFQIVMGYVSCFVSVSSFNFRNSVIMMEDWFTSEFSRGWGMIWWELHLSLFIDYLGVRVSHFWCTRTCYITHGRKAKPAALCVLTELIPSYECGPLRPKHWWALSIVLSVWHRSINKRWPNKMLLVLWVCVSNKGHMLHMLLFLFESGLW